MKLEFLMEYSGRQQSPIAVVGLGPFGTREIHTAAYRSFEGPRLKGKLLPGSSDAGLVDANRVLRLDLRITLQTDDGAYIYLQGDGVWRRDPTRRSRPEGEPADYGDMYIMATPRFETGDERYKWLNELVCVAEGKRNPVVEEGFLADISWQVYAVVND